MSNIRLFFGVFLIIVGIILALSQLGLPIDFGNFWPFLLLVPGLFFWGLFYSKKNQPGISSVLIPGTILVLYSLYFFFNQFTDYKYASETSFIFTFGVALGFFIMYYFGGKKQREVLIPAWILTAISVVIFLGTVGGGNWWPVFIIFLGLFLLYRKDFFKSKNNDESNKIDQGSENS